MDKQHWSISQIWNESFQVEKYEPKVKNYISASEIGKSYLERWYKMKGTPETNPAPDRVLRIFAAGNEFHHLMQRVFEKIGILQSKETYCEIPETPEHLKILGYYDAQIGGFADWTIARENVKLAGFSKFVEYTALKLIDSLEKEYPEGLSKRICEVKSMNSRAFHYHKDDLTTGYEHHQLQLYTYLKATGLSEGVILYISKDDLCLQELPVFNPSERLEEKWQTDIRTMSKYIRDNVKPPADDYIVFDNSTHKYGINWKVSRSSYFDLITGESLDKWTLEQSKKVKEMNKNLKLKGRK